METRSHTKGVDLRAQWFADASHKSASSPLYVSSCKCVRNICFLIFPLKCWLRTTVGNNPTMPTPEAIKNLQLCGKKYGRNPWKHQRNMAKRWLFRKCWAVTCPAGRKQTTDEKVKTLLPPSTRSHFFAPLCLFSFLCCFALFFFCFCFFVVFFCFVLFFVVTVFNRTKRGSKFWTQILLDDHKK